MITRFPNTPRLSGDRNQCPSCGLPFNSTAAFDKHRSGTFTPPARVCLDPTVMLEMGMALNTSGFWVTRPRSSP